MAFEFKIGDWLEYGQYTIVKVIGLGNLEFCGHIFIPCPSSPGEYHYIGERSISCNLIQDYFNNKQIIQQMEVFLLQQK